MSIEPDAEMVSSVAVTPAELDAFIAVYRAACEEALSPSPRLERGAHVPLLRRRGRSARRIPARCSISRNSMVPTPAAPPSKEAYLQLLADGLNLVDAVKDIGKALHDQAKRALETATSCPATRSRQAAPSAIGATRSDARSPR